MDLPKRLLPWDTNYFYHSDDYEELKERGVEIDRMYDFDEIKTKNLADFAWFIAHPGMQNQREFMKSMSEYPSLKIAIVTNGKGNYTIQEDNLKILCTDSEELYNYFFGNNNI